MKKMMLLLLLATTCSVAFSQDENRNNTIQTIFSGNGNNGAYGAFSIGYTQIDGRDALISGGRGAFIVDHSFAIGIAGYGFVNNLDYHNYYNGGSLDKYLAGGYGGILLEPIIAGTMPVHLSFPVLIGMGGVAYFDEYGRQYFDFYENADRDVFFVVEPAVEVEFNLVRFFRAAAFVSYRLTSNIDLPEISPDVLKGLNVGMTFKFGKF